MPYTSYKKLSIQTAATNSGVWGAGGTTGDDLNTGCFSPLDYMLAGISTFSLSSSNVELDFAAGGDGDVQHLYWRLTGTLLANVELTPAAGDASTYCSGIFAWSNETSGNFTVTFTTVDGSVALPQGRRGILYVNAVDNIAPVIVAIAGSGTADPVPAGSKTIWYNTAAPSGWTAVALNDYAIKIVTAGSGGVTSGSVAYSTLFARTATDAHTLTSDETPSHQHFGLAAVTVSGTGSGTQPTNSNYMAQLGSLGNSNAYAMQGTATAATVALTSATGGGNSHTHNIDMRVNTAAFTLATRD